VILRFQIVAAHNDNRVRQVPFEAGSIHAAQWAGESGANFEPIVLLLLTLWALWNLFGAGKVVFNERLRPASST